MASRPTRGGTHPKGIDVPALRLIAADSVKERHNGEVYSCAYTPDEAFVLSGGWDGYLRLWDANTGTPRLSLAASPKPLSSCACSPNGKQWLSGSMEGLLTIWDGVSMQSLLSFIAHTRPISAICFAPDGQVMATSSWDRQVTLRKVGKEREGRILTGHRDIVAGCCFTPDNKWLVSWSHDATIKVWDVNHHQEVVTLTGHKDRVTCLALSPDGRHALSGGRDGALCLWNLERFGLLGSIDLGAEVRACFFLLDAATVVIADAVGRLFLMSVPSFETQTQVQTPFRAISGALAASGSRLALGGEDGLVHLVAIEGMEESPMVVVAQPRFKDEPTLLDRFFGKTRVKRSFVFTCPNCRNEMDLPQLPSDLLPCSRCHRPLRVSSRSPELQPS